MLPLVSQLIYNLGKSVALVGYLLFYLNVLGVRVILQTETPSDKSLGIIFDGNGVREVFTHDAQTYKDGKPCYLLVSADGIEEHPSRHLDFCTNIIAVTSPNLRSKPKLKNWKKQV